MTAILPRAASDASAAVDEVWTPPVLSDRLKILRNFRRLLVARADAFLQALRMVPNRTDAQSLAGELIPLADAARFLERQAPKLLSPRRRGARGRPIWLLGVKATVFREPVGHVLIIAPGNYPLFLGASHCLAALAAGNRVALKPAPGFSHVAELFQRTLFDAGLPTAAMTCLEPDPQSVEQWMQRSNLVVFTGSQCAGRAVMRSAAEHGIPGIFELSGCDAMIVLADADLRLAARCLRFGLTFNASATCIAPRRIIVDDRVANRFVELLRSEIAGADRVELPLPTVVRVRELIQDAQQDGGVLVCGTVGDGSMTPTVIDCVGDNTLLSQEDILAPSCGIVRVSGIEQAITAANRCRYQLGASIFGSAAAAGAIASRLDVGSVVINDIIAPTADPRLPFGGRGDSGFGVTRGAEGLLAMTQIKTVSKRTRGPRLHLMPENAATPAVLAAQLQASHGPSWLSRSSAALRMITLGRSAMQSKEKP